MTETSKLKDRIAKRYRVLFTEEAMRALEGLVSSYGAIDVYEAFAELAEEKDDPALDIVKRIEKRIVEVER